MGFIRAWGSNETVRLPQKGKCKDESKQLASKASGCENFSRTVNPYVDTADYKIEPNDWMSVSVVMLQYHMIEIGSW